MIDRLFFAAFGAVTALAFASGLFGVGSALWNERADAPKIVQLERVVITGKRAQTAAPIASTDAVTPAAQRLQ